LPAALVGCCSVACLLKYCLGPSLAGYEPINRVNVWWDRQITQIDYLLPLINVNDGCVTCPGQVTVTWQCQAALSHEVGCSCAKDRACLK